MPFNLDNALVVKRTACPFPVAFVGMSYGSAADDSEGRVAVMGSAGQFFAAYITQTQRYVIDTATPYAALSQAIEAADALTRYACEPSRKIKT